MSWWMVVLAVLAALYLLGLLRLGGRVRYDEDGVVLTGIAGPLRLVLFPRKEKAQKDKAGAAKPSSKEKKKPESAAAHPKKGGSVERFVAVLPTAAEAAGALRRKLCIQRLELSLVWGGKDAAAAALGYGRANALLGAIWPLLDNDFKIKHHDIRLDLDYTACEPKIAVDAVVTIRLGQMLWLGLHYGVKLLKQWSRSGKAPAQQEQEAKQ